MRQPSPETILNLSPKKKAALMFAFFAILALGTNSGSSFNSGPLDLFNNIIDKLFVSWLGRGNTTILFAVLAVLVPLMMLRKKDTKKKFKARKIKSSDQPAEKKYSVEDQHLGAIYNATTNDGFEWMFAHLDRLSDFYPIRETLIKRGYPEIAELTNKMFTLYCTAENVEGVTKSDLPPDECYDELRRLDQQAHDAGTFDKFNADMDELFKI